MLNKVELIGNLGADPEFLDGIKICKFSLATTENWKDKEGNKKEATEWHNCVVFGKLAEIANMYLRKGSKIFAEGKIKYDSYEKDGIKRYSTSINIRNFIMLGRKNEATTQASASSVQPSQQYDDSDESDDIPF